MKPQTRFPAREHSARTTTASEGMLSSFAFGGEGWGEEAVCSQHRAWLIGLASRRRPYSTTDPLSPTLSPLVPRGERESPGRAGWYGRDAPLLHKIRLARS